jgi:cbb3-type cytochrome oxidase subunit 3
MPYLALLVQALDPVPSDNDVKAGWGAFGVFALLILAVAFLCWSFVRQMRKVNAADEAGVFDEPSDPADDLPPTHTRSE